MGPEAFPDFQFQAGLGDEGAFNTGKLKTEMERVF